MFTEYKVCCDLIFISNYIPLSLPFSLALSLSFPLFHTHAITSAFSLFSSSFSLFLCHTPKITNSFPASVFFFLLHTKTQELFFCTFFFFLSVCLSLHLILTMLFLIRQLKSSFSIFFYSNIVFAAIKHVPCSTLEVS